MYRKSIIEKSFKTWYEFYKLINNKTSLDENDAAVAKLKITYAYEEFQMQKKELEGILEEEGIEDIEIINRRETYVENSRFFIPTDIGLDGSRMIREDLNAYLFSVIYNIIRQNIDIYFKYSDVILREDEISNINTTTNSYSQHREVIDKLMRLLYLFKNTEKTIVNNSIIESYLIYSIKTEGVFFRASIKEVLEELTRDGIIICDWAGNYSIISEEKKRLSKQLSIENDLIKSEEKNEFILCIVYDVFREVISNMDKEELISNIIVDEEIIHKSYGNTEIRIDNYYKENRDIRRASYVLNTRKDKKVIFWYAKRNLGIYEEAKYLIAYMRSIKVLLEEWKNDDERLKFLEHQKKQYNYLLNKIRQKIIALYRDGSYIFNGEDKRVENDENIDEILKNFISKVN